MNQKAQRFIALFGAASLLTAGVLFARTMQDTRAGLGRGVTGTGSPVNAARTDHTFDDLTRVTRVDRQSGHYLSYGYDAAGNITSAATVGRSSASRRGEIVNKGNLAGKFTFEGDEGEAVTLRLEASPREAGVGKFAEVKLDGKTVISAFPVELTHVLPRSGKFVVRVKKANNGKGGYYGQKNKDPYVGPYDLTLEASPKAVASFSLQPKIAESNVNLDVADFLDGRRGR